MRCVFAALMVITVAAPAFGRDLMTVVETSVHVKPKNKSAVLTTIATNVRVPFDKRKDNWFRVTVDVGGKAVTGWVNRKQVTDMMGRSTGQLLAANQSLYDEVVELRKAKQKLRAELAAAKTKNDDTEAKLKAALDPVDQLKAANARRRPRRRN